MERPSQPLTEQEQAQWETIAAQGISQQQHAYDTDELDRLARSREAMIIDGKEQHLLGFNTDGVPVEQTTIQTTTLISTEHHPESGVAIKQNVQERPISPELQIGEQEERELSQGSAGIL